MKNGYRVWLAGMSVLALFVVGGLKGSDNEAIVQFITKFDGGCCSSCDDLDVDEDLIRAWYDEITDSDRHGNALEKDGFYQNGSVVNSDFADAVAYSWGADDEGDGIDDSDIAMFSTHGSDPNGSRWSGEVRVNESGSGDCVIEQEELILGNDDLEIFFLMSCETMNEESWWPEWSDSFEGIHQIEGFHGLYVTCSGYEGRFRDLGDDGFDIGVADAFIDNLYDGNTPGSGSFDQCPVARSVGTSKSNASSRLSNEEYDNRGNYSDLPSGTSRYHIVRYIKGCDPEDEGPLPN